ncbi:hypothetical protein [Nonomuraea sp. LPB2021202275-12-8]|uniref:hypothetical protein n=1 Tax=Nonomuraea sp. LPB2021202275-12-8 TaxID=3120159 RepID=UPI00300CC479
MMTALALIKRYKSERTNHTKYYATGETVPVDVIDETGVLSAADQLGRVRQRRSRRGEGMTYEIDLVS